jgi:hypothetical protein
LSYGRDIIQKKQIILFEKDFRRRILNVPLSRVIACHLREGYIVKEWKKRDSKIFSVKLLLAWRPAVHIIYSAEMSNQDDNITEITISIEGKFLPY